MRFKNSSSAIFNRRDESSEAQPCRGARLWQSCSLPALALWCKSCLCFCLKHSLFYYYYYFAILSCNTCLPCKRPSRTSYPEFFSMSISPLARIKVSWREKSTIAPFILIFLPGTDGESCLSPSDVPQGHGNRGDSVPSAERGERSV